MSATSTYSNEPGYFRKRGFQFASLGLRPKLVLAFGTIAAIASFFGAVSLLFVVRSSATVTTFIEVTSPLLTESVALVENAQRTRSAFVDAIDRGESGDGIAARLVELEAQTRAHIATLRALAYRAETDIQLDTITERASAFYGSLFPMISASALQRTAETAARANWLRYEAAYEKIRTSLIALADRAEGRMMKGEDEVKVQVQTRSATVDGLGDSISDILNNDYPVVQNASRMLREIEQTDHTVRLLYALPSLERLPGIEQDLRQSWRVLGSIAKRLASRLRTPANQADALSLSEGIAEIDAAILGKAGLLQNRRESAATRAWIAAGRQSFDQIESAYFAILDNVTGVVHRLNQNAKVRTASQLQQAHIITSLGVLATLAGGTLISLLFGSRMTRPIIRLAEQVRDIRTSGELHALPDSVAVDRHDEIGTLSRSFNLMIAELAEARRQLIAQSEAEVHQQYERLHLAINSMPQGLCMFDADQHLIVSNRRYCEIYGLSPDQTKPGTDLRTLLTFSATEQGIAAAEQRKIAVADGKPWHSAFELPDGRVIAISHLPVPNGGSIATHEDITERRRSEAQIAHMAHHDMLTDLPNRVKFRDDMLKAIEAKRDAPVAVLCLDLDYFKNVNDTLGHPVGDALLQAVAARLRSCLRSADSVARLGGDEFAIVQTEVDQPIAATALAERLVDELSAPFTVQGHQVAIGASVGISLCPADGQDPDALLKNADMALYRAKEDGRGTYRFFEPEMDARMQARRALELDLRKALALQEFELFYQPIVNLATGQFSACEALLRWRHPERGLVAPGEFVPLAEETGLINHIGAWCLKQACVEAQKWQPHISIAVNLSPTQFKSGNLVSDVAEALRLSGLSACRLELEITESVLIAETESTLATLNQLREMGVHIAMDDFGTGYSSLGYLRKFPFDKIKIDQSFIANLADQPESIAIIRAVAGLGSTLGIRTTAEGVETEAQLRQLKIEGCSEAQGFLFSRPKTASELSDLLGQTKTERDMAQGVRRPFAADVSG